MNIAEADIAQKSQWKRFLAGFRRITTSGNYIPEIDGLRFIAISAVILHHVALFVCDINRRPEGLFELGTRGVELFFAISGFILALPFATHFLAGGPRVKIGQYLLRRITRLEPPYLAALVLVFLLKVLTRDLDMTESLPYLAASCAYMHCALFGMTSYVLGVAWSLEIEVQFYLLMPVLALVFLIRNNVLRRALLLTAMLGIVLMQPMVRNSLLSGVHWQSNVGEKIVISNVLADMVWQRHIGNYIQFFLAGILLADVYVVSWRNRPTRQFWGDVVWFIGWPVTFWMLTFDHLASRLLFPLMIFVLYAAMFRSNIARRVMSIPLIATIGGMCYSIYLLHNTGIQLAGKAIRPILGGLPFALQMLVALLMMVPMILIVCGLFYRLVERPCMHRDWPQRLWGMLFVDTDQAKGGSRS